MSGAPTQWLTTAPNPRAPQYGADQGQRGWRQHAVKAANTETFAEMATREARALCGLLPNHGWSIDLFANEMAKCKRCERKAVQPGDGEVGSAEAREAFNERTKRRSDAAEARRVAIAECVKALRTCVQDQRVGLTWIHLDEAIETLEALEKQ